MADLQGSCRWAGCTEQHLHPVTGVPPDYHFVVGCTKKPVWSEPSYRRRARDRRDWWYRVEEVAAACTVAPGTVRGWIKSGQLKAFRPSTPPSPWLIRGRDLEDFVRSRGEAYPKEMNG